MSAPAIENTSTRSAECALAAQDGYQTLHRDCRQTEDIPLPNSIGILLVERCGCWCHPYSKQPPAPRSGW